MCRPHRHDELSRIAIRHISIDKRKVDYLATDAERPGVSRPASEHSEGSGVACNPCWAVVNDFPLLLIPPGMGIPIESSCRPGQPMSQTTRLPPHMALE